MIAASGKWMGNSEGAQPTARGIAPGVAGLLGVGAPPAAGHESFADAMQRSAIDVGKDEDSADVSGSKTVASSVMGVEATAGKVAVGKMTDVATPLVRGGSVVVSAKSGWRKEPEDHSGKGVSAEEAASTDVSPQKGLAATRAATTAATVSAGSEAAGRAHAEDVEDLNVVAAPLETAAAAKTATTETKKPKTRSDAKWKESKGHAASASGDAVSSGAARVVAPAGFANAAAMQGVVKTPVAAQASMTGEAVGKAKPMQLVAPAAIDDGKALTPSAGVMKGSGNSSVDGGVDAKNGAVDATVTMAVNVPTAQGAPMTVAVVAQGHSLNLPQGANATAGSHVAAGGGSAALLQGAATNELKLTTMEAAKPNQLEVGLRGGEFGWLKVRAEMGTNGEVNAFLRGATVGTTDALQVQAPKIAAYLGANDVAVRGVHVEAAQSSGGSSSAGFAGGDGAGSAAQQQAFGSRQKRPAGIATNEDGAADMDGGNDIAVPLELVSGRSVVSLTGTGNWLSVRA